MAKFLSDEWFAVVSEQTKQAGDLKLSATLQSVNMNFEIIDDNNKDQLNFLGGIITKGLNQEAPTTIIVEKNLLFEVAGNFSTDDAVDAFLSGQARIAGDLSQLMAIQSTKISLELQTLLFNILQHTQM